MNKMIIEAIPYKNLGEKINIINRLKKLKKKMKYINWKVEDGVIIYQLYQFVNNDDFIEPFQQIL